MNKIYPKNKDVVHLYIIFSLGAYICANVALLSANSLPWYRVAVYSLFFPFVIFSPIWSNWIYIKNKTLQLFIPFLRQINIMDIQEISTASGLFDTKGEREFNDLNIVYTVNGKRKKRAINSWLYTPQTLALLLLDIKGINPKINFNKGCNDWINKYGND